MGGNWYCRANGDALFEIEKPLTTMGVGFDNMPEYIKKSNILSANNLGQLGNIEHIPTKEEVIQYKNSGAINEMFELYSNDKHKLEEHLHHMAKRLLEEKKVTEAWKVLLAVEHID
jgi:hypothetical protein